MKTLGSQIRSLRRVLKNRGDQLTEEAKADIQSKINKLIEEANGQPAPVVPLAKRIVRLRNVMAAFRRRGLMDRYEALVPQLEELLKEEEDRKRKTEDFERRRKANREAKKKKAGLHGRDLIKNDSTKKRARLRDNEESGGAFESALKKLKFAAKSREESDVSDNESQESSHSTASSASHKKPHVFKGGHGSDSDKLSDDDSRSDKSATKKREAHSPSNSEAIKAKDWSSHQYGQNVNARGFRQGWERRDRGGRGRDGRSLRGVPPLASGEESIFELVE